MNRWLWGRRMVKLSLISLVTHLSALLHHISGQKDLKDSSGGERTSRCEIIKWWIAVKWWIVLRSANGESANSDTRSSFSLLLRHITVHFDLNDSFGREITNCSNQVNWSLLVAQRLVMKRWILEWRFVMNLTRSIFFRSLVTYDCVNQINRQIELYKSQGKASLTSNARLMPQGKVMNCCNVGD